MLLSIKCKFTRQFALANNSGCWAEQINYSILEKGSGGGKREVEEDGRGGRGQGPLKHWKRSSNIRHENFRSFVRLFFVSSGYPTLDSETGCTGELWSNRVVLISEN